jgi:hypothetical protein
MPGSSKAMSMAISVADFPSVASIGKSMASVFPLPLTILETFMLADSRAGYPMMCDIELEFEGRLDRAAFEAALAFALARNPLFTCRIEPGKRGQLQWVLTDEMPVVQWVSMDEPLDDTYGAMADLTSQSGMRVWVRHETDRTKVLLHCHHACADALGSFGFIGDLLAGYALACGQQVTPRIIEPHRLLMRGQAGLDGRSLWRRIYDAVVGSREGARFFLHSPKPLAPSPNAPEAPATVGPIYTTRTLPEDVTLGLRVAARSGKATTNDVLLRDLYRTMRRWNAEHGEPLNRRKLRILMPQNLRTNEDYSMPAANVMSFAFVTRRAHLCDAPGAMLESLREETDAVRRGRLSLYFLGGLESLQSNGLLKPVLNGSFCFASAILTNVGDPTRRLGTTFARSKRGGLTIGDVVLRSIAAVPPLRPQTRAAFAVVNHGRTMSINLKWDPRSFSPLDAEQLLGQYVAQLQATAHGTDAPASQQR